MDGKPLWIRGDSNRGLALWPVPDGFVLSVHLDAEATDLHLSQDDVAALGEAIGDALRPTGVTPVEPMAVELPEADLAAPAEAPEPGVPQVKVRPGPPCDRCKSPTDRTADGYACTKCGNVIVWV